VGEACGAQVILQEASQCEQLRVQWCLVVRLGFHMSDSLDQPIDELDISVRTIAFLKSLGVNSVAQLLKVPRISAPHKLILAELEMLFEDLEVTYLGALSGPILPAAKQSAKSGTVAERWAVISKWLEKEHPKALAQFFPPTSLAVIAGVEQKLKQTLPEDYKQFLLLHNGQEEFAPMVGVGSGSLFQVEQIPDACLGIFGEETPVDASEVDAGIRAVDYCNAWIPIARSSRNRDYLCIDLDPAPGGTRGQIIEYIVDFSARRLVAKSFADLLGVYFEQAQTGQLDLDVDFDD
jgi:cell wall assembly regulator SMI1